MKGYKNMIKILFVCHGNICRSPMAEFLMKDLVQKKGISDQFLIASAATSNEEIGNPPHYGTRQKLSSLGISCRGKQARRMTSKDFDDYDYLLGMDSWNIRNMKRFARNPKAFPPTQRPTWPTLGIPGILKPLIMILWKDWKVS